MELINATRMLAGYTMGLELSGRELLVVVIKGTFRIPQAGEPIDRIVLADDQLPLVMADTFTGEPGFSSPVYEADFAPRKPQCDVLLHGSAYAPGGRPTTRLEAGIQIGPWSKHVAVVGPRHWECSAATLRASPVQPFVQQAISYDVAFGGADLRHEDSAKHAAYMANPVGRGFHKHMMREWVDGAPLPSTEEPGRSVTDTDGDYRPMAFGPIGRGWQPRGALAGTYDDDWLDKHFPFLPPDFDERYHQAAPADQQLPLAFFTQGPREVVLTNLTPSGSCRFMLPNLVAPVHVFLKRGAREDYTANLDTIVFEPDQHRFTMTWRVARPLKRNMFEVAQVLVGRKGRDWWQEHEQLDVPSPVGMASLDKTEVAEP